MRVRAELDRDVALLVLAVDEGGARDELDPGDLGERHLDLEWVGEFSNLQGAIARLKLVVPLTIGLIALLLYAPWSRCRTAR
jgi:hypothetical protein